MAGSESAYSPAESSQASGPSKKPPYVTHSSQWDEYYEIFVMLWPGMTLPELKKIMEDTYRFRATEDQYKKKFRQWKDQGKLPPKKPRKGDKGKTQHQDESDLGRCTQPVTTEDSHGLATPVSISDHGIDIPNKGSVIESPSPTTPTAHHEETQQPTPPPSEIGDASNHQQKRKFHWLLFSLWDAHFDAEHRDAKHVEVGNAVRNMIEFLLEIGATDPNFVTIEERTGDLDLLRIYIEMVHQKYPSQEPLLTRLSRLAMRRQGRSIRLGYLNGTWKFFYAGREPGMPLEGPRPKKFNVGGTMTEIIIRGTSCQTAIIYCCFCGDGPYLTAVNTGCLSYTCTNHRFCSNCPIEIAR